MRYVDEFRDGVTARAVADAIARITTRRWTIMEICGGQTHAILRFGIDELLPDTIELVHGPGCPVCVTPVELIDKAIAIATHPDVIFCSFGDMIRVPGSSRSLLEVKSTGADIRIVYSPLDAVTLARNNPDRRIVFFGIGFETTAPANAMAVHFARQQGVDNFSMLVSHVLVPPAIKAILASPDNRVQGFLAAGHVCSVMGYHEYHAISGQYRVPIVVTGFEPVDILQGVYMTVRQLESGLAEVENQYGRCVVAEGNREAQKLIQEVFEVAPRNWRGVGTIPESGLRLRPSYISHDAESQFELQGITPSESDVCIAGQVLQGVKRPHQCPVFGSDCTPESPLGAPMVSTEGACAAYYRYRRHSIGVREPTTGL